MLSKTNKECELLTRRGPRSKADVDVFKDYNSNWKKIRSTTCLMMRELDALLAKTFYQTSRDAVVKTSYVESHKIFRTTLHQFLMGS